MIIDSQVHIWKAESAERPWSSKAAHLPYPFGYEELLSEMKRAGVDRAVLVPPGWEGDRIDFALEAVRHYHLRFGVMGRIPVERPESAALLPGWNKQAGMLGIRLSFQKEDRGRWFAEGRTDWFWPEAEKYDIPIMIFAPGKTADLREIAISYPKLRIIVDHMGLGREQDSEAVAAMEELCRLADCPNVYVKLSSVPLYSSEPYPYRNLHGGLRRMVGSFGPQRCFWGTDLTRIWNMTSYQQMVSLFMDELDFLSSDDLAWIMGRALAECLRWSDAK